MSLGSDRSFPDRRGTPPPGLPFALWQTPSTHESEATFHTLVDSIKDYSIFMLDIHGNVTSWNAGAQRIKGWEAHEIMGRHFSCLYPADDVAINKPQLALEIAIAMGRSEDEGWRVRKDGSHFWANVIITAIRNAQGQLLGFAKVTRDITERQTAAQKQERHRQELQEYIDSMGTFNAKVALDGTLLIVNQAAKAVAGLPVETLMQTKFLDGHWWNFDPAVKARVSAAFERAVAGTPVNYDERLCIGNRVITINFSLIPVRGADGEVAYLVAEGRDITTLKRAEDALKHRTAQLETANRELEAFAYSVSHDLRAPLRSIEGFTQALIDDYSRRLDTTGVTHLQRVHAASRRMTELIDALLKLSHLSRSELHYETVDLSALAHSILEALRQSEPERMVQIQIEPKLTVRGDAQLLRVMLDNLLGNAWKFTRKTSQPEIEVGCTMLPEHAAFYVRDNGAGFDSNFSHRLFGPFQRLHDASEYEGNGIGLATVQRIISRHGGTIWGEGQPQAGATFYFTLPE